MKKLLLFTLAAFSLNTIAQNSIQIKDMDNNVLVAANGTIEVETIPEENFKVNLDVKNLSSTSTNTYIAKRYNVRLNNEANAFFCFAGQCYANDVQVSTNKLKLKPDSSASQLGGDSNILTADLDEGTAVGYSHIKYTFMNENNVNDSVQVNIVYNKDLETVGIKEARRIVSSFEIFPNPAKEIAVLRINSPKTFSSTLVIFNSLGESVHQKALTINEGNNKIDVQIDGLPAGVYFATIKTGQTIISKNLIKN